MIERYTRPEMGKSIRTRHICLKIVTVMLDGRYLQPPASQDRQELRDQRGFSRIFHTADGVK